MFIQTVGKKIKYVYSLDPDVALILLQESESQKLQQLLESFMHVLELYSQPLWTLSKAFQSNTKLFFGANKVRVEAYKVSVCIFVILYP